MVLAGPVGALPSWVVATGIRVAHLHDCGVALREQCSTGGGLTLRQIDVALERCDISVPPIPAATVPPTTTTAPPTTRVSYDHFGLGAGALEPLNPENQESGAAGGARVVWAWALGAAGLVLVWGRR